MKERETVNEQVTRDYPALGPLEKALRTYRERRGAYGPSERVFGEVMHALLKCKNFEIATVDDYVRYGILVQIVGKLCRYVAMPNVGHLDSIHDLGVYAFMLEGEDRRIQNPPSPPSTDEQTFWRIRNVLDEMRTEHNLPIGDLDLNRHAQSMQKRLSLPVAP